jgi:hypothetical protein
MDTAKIKRLPLSRLRVLAQQYGIADVEGLDRKALLQALAALNVADSPAAQPAETMPTPEMRSPAPQEVFAPTSPVVEVGFV